MTTAADQSHPGATPGAVTRHPLTRLSATELANGIAAGRFSSVEVVEAHIRRIEATHAALNAVVVPLFDRARADAAAADLSRNQGRPLGPLHGVPVTIKECFHVAGTASTLGVGWLAAEKFSADGVLVRRLRRAGAIVLGKTNVPQLMLLHETDNPVYGRTNNPWDLARGPGGSSGGEAAIIAAGGSPLGLASDLGGSIRQPAHTCGICGLMPTFRRLTNAGKRGNFLGMEAVSLQPGPMARSVADLELALGVLIGQSPDDLESVAADFDPLVAPMPLRKSADVAIKRLRIGFWIDDGYFAASPAIRRAVTEAAAALAARGAHVEPFAPPDVPQAMRLYFGLLSADGGANLKRTLGASPMDWRIRRLMRVGEVPKLLRPVMQRLFASRGQNRSVELLRSIRAASADGYWQLTLARAEYAEQFLSAMQTARLDALVFPPHALPALTHGATRDLPQAASYSFLANLLGIPAGVLPATRVGAGEESDRPASRDAVERAAIAVERGSAGLPVDVQVAARAWREDVVLAVMTSLESHFRAQVDYPTAPPI